MKSQGSELLIARDFPNVFRTHIGIRIVCVDLLFKNNFLSPYSSATRPIANVFRVARDFFKT